MIEQAERSDFFRPGDRRRSSAAQRYFDLIAEKHRGRWQGEMNPVRTEVTDPALLTQQVKEYARSLGADLVGVSQVNQAWVYKGRQVEQMYAVSLGMEMDYHRIEKTPGDEAGTEAARVYYELGEVTIRLAEYIRGLGYPAFSHHPLGGGALLLIPCAMDAGLGELGRNSLAISREFGPRFRLGCVTTDLPLLVDTPADLGVSEFCERCQACLKACPSGAIPESRQVVRGIQKYTIDAYKCRQFRQEAGGCAICIKVCVFNQLAHRGKWLEVKKAIH